MVEWNQYDRTLWQVGKKWGLWYPGLILLSFEKTKQKNTDPQSLERMQNVTEQFASRLWHLYFYIQGPWLNAAYNNNKLSANSVREFFLPIFIFCSAHCDNIWQTLGQYKLY